MMVLFDMVRGLDELVVCDDSIDWPDEVAPRGSVSVDALASCQCVTFFRRGIGDALTPLRIRLLIMRAVVWNCRCRLHCLLTRLYKIGL